MNYRGAFLQFLTKEAVIGKVYDICQKPIMALLNNEEPEDYLLSLFLFEKTNEGSVFWGKIQDKWMDYLEELRNGGQE